MSLFDDERDRGNFFSLLPANIDEKVLILLAWSFKCHASHEGSVSDKQGIPHGMNEDISVEQGVTTTNHNYLHKYRSVGISPMRTARCLSSHRRPDGGVKVASPPKLQQRHHSCARSPIQARTSRLLESFQSSCWLKSNLE